MAPTFANSSNSTYAYLYLSTYGCNFEFSNLPECRLVLKRLPGKSTSELGTSSGTTSLQKTYVRIEWSDMCSTL